MSDFWFGDIAVGILTDKDTDISKETVEKNFVDEPVQVYELTPNLESGTYSFFLNKDMHPRSETISEQRDAVLSMPDRHVSEFPMEMGGDSGHVLVDQTNTSITPSEMIDEGNVTLRFMDKDTYRPALYLYTDSINDVFSWPSDPSSIAAIPTTVSNVSTNGAVSQSFTLTTEEGDLDIYEYQDLDNPSKGTIEYDRPTDYTSGERISPVRVFNSSDERIYSCTRNFAEGSEIKNGVIRCNFNQTDCDFGIYTGSWRTIGSVNFDVSDGYIKEPSNYNTELGFVESGHYCYQRRGFPVMRFDVTGTTSFTFNSDETVSQGSTANAYRTVTSDSNGDEFILIRTSTDGSFSDDSSTLEVTGLDSSSEYTFFFGFVPSSVNASDMAEYAYHIGEQRRTLVQK